MAEIGFYHLTRSSFAEALPALLGRTLAAGERAVVVCAEPAQVSLLDSALWQPEWLPHGTEKTPHPEWQPVFLTVRDENPAGAGFLFLIGGARADAGAYSRVFDLFDGNSGEEVAAARERWKEAKSAGHVCAYWKQEERGWVKGA